ncbi:MAG: prepilin peptidase [Defluviitaleaceae bacterium]|nr:prepilin peptidase [Defluviitaleaceae bacterium]
MHNIIVTVFVIFGLCFGSFANVLIYRLPLGKSVIFPSSSCPYCTKKLSMFDLVPVFSWLFLFGKCRNCKKKISFRYTFVELLCGFLFGIMAWHNSIFNAIPLAFLCFILVSITFIDIDTQTIPDSLLIFAGIIGIIWVISSVIYPYTFNSPTIIDSIFGTIAGGGILFIMDKLTILIAKKDGFGYGDVKLMAICGIFIGLNLTLISYFFAFIIGGIFATFLIILRKVNRGSYMAFGPFLAIGVVMAILYGFPFINWLLF